MCGPAHLFSCGQPHSRNRTSRAPILKSYGSGRAGTRARGRPGGWIARARRPNLNVPMTLLLSVLLRNERRGSGTAVDHSACRATPHRRASHRAVRLPRLTARRAGAGSAGLGRPDPAGAVAAAGDQARRRAVRCSGSRCSGEKSTIEDILGPDYLKGPVPPCRRHDAPGIPGHGDAEGRSGLRRRSATAKAMTVAATSFALQWALQKAIHKFQDAQSRNASTKPRARKCRTRWPSSRKRASRPASRPRVSSLSLLQERFDLVDRARHGLRQPFEPCSRSADTSPRSARRCSCTWRPSAAPSR